MRFSTHCVVAGSTVGRFVIAATWRYNTHPNTSVYYDHFTRKSRAETLIWLDTSDDGLATQFGFYIHYTHITLSEFDLMLPWWFVVLSLLVLPISQLLRYCRRAAIARRVHRNYGFAPLNIER
jgi:hypothetical protein